MATFNPPYETADKASDNMELTIAELEAIVGGEREPNFLEVYLIRPVKVMIAAGID